jgi:hypothetical protein
VRDGKTGKILIQPPKEDLWLLPEKSGWGRAARNEFDVISEFGPEFFEKMVSIEGSITNVAKTKLLIFRTPSGNGAPAS